MKYSLLILGFLFLWNPEVTIIDLLPDFIGFLLIAKALAPLAAASPSAEAATGKFRKLAAISGIKVVSVFPMMSLAATEPEITMIFTAGFAILTAMYLFPAFSDLFASVTYFSERSQTKVKGTAFIKYVTFLVFLLRYALAFFPETVYLKVDETLSEIYGYAVYPWEPFRTGITVLAVALSLLIGIVWLIFALVYLSRLKVNHALNDGIRREVEASYVPYGKLLLSSSKTALLILVFASFSIVSFPVDGVPIFPAALFPILILIAVSYLKKPLSLSFGYLILPTLGAVAGLVSHASVMKFCEAHHDRAAIEFAPYKDAFLLPFIAESVAFLLQAACLLFCVMPILRKWILTRRQSEFDGQTVTANPADKQEQLRLSFLSFTYITLAVLYSVAKIVSYWFFYRNDEGRMIITAIGIGLGFLGWYLFSSLKQRLNDVHGTI